MDGFRLFQVKEKHLHLRFISYLEIHSVTKFERALVNILDVGLI